ncbi:MAG: bifunctional riboflavin kinase/FAD synthetase [Eubacteriales bacterium]|nr:bifunctional riboflavin kinase/FAD synthetase [Eubacteriales bacterium]MDD3196912.1 bifunctional riboflavin kinase/FAD synthetase [Eubacteriales bacterium]MDD3503332.1 bifunctional riboflavin kinase/FAD synthetase [Eubacteriales bacterium]MDD4682217.1 bifunctional riboflavin kinase/FAD synthetase [Eubacteriales bacterium]
MKIFDQSENEIPKLRRGVALGFFDGVHRGHADLIRTLVMNCCQLDLEPAVFTFDEHPATVAHSSKRFSGYINTLAERLELFEQLGVSEVHHYHFDEQFSHLDPEEFLNTILLARLQAGLIVVGEDYRYGYKGEGNVTALRSWCDRNQIKLVVVPDVEIFGQKISSTRIRRLVEMGDMDHAASCLGRPFSLRGEVVKGRKLGRELGFPTANFAVAAGQISPAYGVYVTRTRIGSRTWWSITSFGLRPTIGANDSVPMVETYIYDTRVDLYGQEIEVFFLEMLRPEKKFDSLLQLGAQIKEDLQQAYIWHQKSEDSYISNYVKSIPVWVLQTDRFSQGSLQFVFQHKLERQRAAAFALLMQVLTASCRRFPGRTELSTELDRLYGSSLDSHVEKHGDLQTLTLSAEGLINWTDGSKPFADTVRLLFDVLLDPDIDEDGYFDQAIVDSERQSLITELKARENDRARYAYDRSMQIFCADKPHGIRATGDIESLEKLTQDDLSKAYRELVTELPAMICVGGRIDTEMLELIYSSLDKLPSERSASVFGSIKPSMFNNQQPEQEIKEYRKLEQARVNLVLTGLPPYFSHRSIAASMLNSMLGGDVHSLLFDVVREKMGLAYSVYSVNARYLSALLVLAGIDADKTDAAVSAMKEQIAVLVSGKFDARLFETSKRLLAASVEASHDDISHMVSAVVSAVILGRNMSIRDALSLLDNVSREDIISLASELKLAVNYRLLPDTLREDIKS